MSEVTDWVGAILVFCGFNFQREFAPESSCVDFAFLYFQVFSHLADVVIFSEILG